MVRTKILAHEPYRNVAFEFNTGQAIFEFSLYFIVQKLKKRTSGAKTTYNERKQSISPEE